MSKVGFTIDRVLARQAEKNRAARAAYEEKRREYPRGTLEVRDTAGHRYCYLRYREGDRVITKYAGTAKHLSEIKKAVKARDRLTERIKLLDAEYERILKMQRIK